MEAKVYSIDGADKETIELNDEVFAREISEGAIYQVIKGELERRRLGTAHSKTRSEVNGSKAKPWRQKGTGRARAGRRRSPIWVGGGVTFGPRKKDINAKVPKQMRRAAIKSILTMKLSEKRLKIVEDFAVESGKTKDFAKILGKLTDENRTIVILGEGDALMRRAGRNIPGVDFVNYNQMHAHSLFYGKTIICLKSAALKLNDFYSVKSKKEVQS